jgi:hypothetical protein
MNWIVIRYPPSVFFLVVGLQSTFDQWTFVNGDGSPTAIRDPPSSLSHVPPSPGHSPWRSSWRSSPCVYVPRPLRFPPLQIGRSICALAFESLPDPPPSYTRRTSSKNPPRRDVTFSSPPPASYSANGQNFPLQVVVTRPGKIFAT